MVLTKCKLLCISVVRRQKMVFQITIVHWVPSSTRVPRFQVNFELGTQRWVPSSTRVPRFQVNFELVSLVQLGSQDFR